MYIFVAIWTLLAFVALIGLKPYFVRSRALAAPALSPRPQIAHRLPSPPPLLHPSHARLHQPRRQLVCLVALSLNVSNVIGYMKCSKDAAKKLKEYAGAYVGRQIGERLMSRMLSQESGDADEHRAEAAGGDAAGKPHERP